MKKIILWEFYQWYLADEFIYVSDEVAEELRTNRLYGGRPLADTLLEYYNSLIVAVIAMLRIRFAGP